MGNCYEGAAKFPGENLKMSAARETIIPSIETTTLPGVARHKVMVINEAEGLPSEWYFERDPKRNDVISREETGLLYKVLGLSSLGYLWLERFESRAGVEQAFGWDGPPVKAWLRW
jgi:hypothetical protein